MKSIFTILLITFFFSASAQRCATDEYLLTRKSAVSDMSGMRKNNLTSGRDTLKNEVIVVPVVVHVLYNNANQNIPDERIVAQIDALNRDFRRKNADTVNTPLPFKHLAADTRIVFCLAKVDPNGFKTSGIIRKYTKEDLFLADDQMKFSARGGDDAWDASKYLNIWVCDLFGRTLGYATLPGGNPLVDGIVIQFGAFGFKNGLSEPYNLGRTLTHETGHWLGLKHIWGDIEGGACASDDIDDTPPQSSSNSGCQIFPKMSACSVNQYGDMFMNYMDFSNDACMNLFTYGQKSKMRSQFARGGARNSFLNASQCDDSGAEEAPEVKEEHLVIRVYPNPVIDKLVIDLGTKEHSSGKIFSLYNIQGKLLQARSLQVTSTSITLSNYPDGLYVIVVGDSKNNKTFKILKQSKGSGAR